ncbi:hypothetical protein RhiirA4_461411 [Rhizophagus irregularis]|uniref:Peptidase M12A domain-containing protein n=1 Tax=Rhizophagus irregularis TaxID=588596 RepID=A0A2I1GIS8_9GLOM|nr:hypothetical protein RhiirA4_461411 [Rhizophagus irregularis]
MYALGFYHEHCRPDRDNYWTVTAKEILEKINHALSLGCYSGGRHIQAKPVTERTNAIGQRVKLSAYDINALNALYPSSSYLPLRRSLKMKDGFYFQIFEIISINNHTLNIEYRYAFFGHVGVRRSKPGFFVEFSGAYSLDAYNHGILTANFSGCVNFGREKLAWLFDYLDAWEYDRFSVL